MDHTVGLIDRLFFQPCEKDDARSFFSLGSTRKSCIEVWLVIAKQDNCSIQSGEKLDPPAPAIRAVLVPQSFGFQENFCVLGQMLEASNEVKSR